MRASICLQEACGCDLQLDQSRQHLTCQRRPRLVAGDLDALLLGFFDGLGLPRDCGDCGKATRKQRACGQAAAAAFRFVMHCITRSLGASANLSFSSKFATLFVSRSCPVYFCAASLLISSEHIGTLRRDKQAPHSSSPASSSVMPTLFLTHWITCKRHFFRKARDRRI